MKNSIPQLVILGSSGHAFVVADAALASGHQIAGYLSPERHSDSGELGGYLGKDDQSDELRNQGFSFAVGIGFVDRDGAARRRAILQKFLESDLATVCHPSSTISRTSVLGTGAFIAAGAIVSPYVTIENSVIINTQASVDHNSIIGANSHVAVGATIAGSVKVGKNCLIGAGATVIQGVTIGNNSIIGAGAVVLSDVSADTFVCGVPAVEKV